MKNMKNYWYEGKEVCQGCGKPGTEVRRDSKDKLCPECNKMLTIAKSNDFEYNSKYQSIKDWYNGYVGIDYDDKSLDLFATSLLEKLNNRFIHVSFGDQIRTKRGRNIHGSVHYNLPIGISRLIVKLLDTLDLHYNIIRDKRQEAERYMNECIKQSEVIAKIEVEKERDRIFNEGIEKGKNILFQLNSGDISVNELNNNYSYSERK